MFNSLERQWIEENKDLLESGDLDRISKALHFKDFEDKILLALGYVLGGPQAFEFIILDNGPSRSLSRANAGQRILKIRLNIKPIPGYTNLPLQLVEWKGTFNPKDLKRLMGPALHKWLSPKGGKYLKGLEEYLMNNTDWDILK